MTTHDWVSLFIVLLFLVLAFVFSGSETALTASSRGTMLRLAKSGNPDAIIVTRLLENRQRLIGALLIGNNVATIVSSALATELLLYWFGDVGVIYASVAMTILVIVFCELLPKTAAIIAPDRYALAVARPTARTVAVLGPVLAAAEWLVRKMLAPASGRGRASRCCLRTNACAARSTCCTGKAASKSSIATCSADCWTCATSPWPM